jgi:hypothetical protein
MTTVQEQFNMHNTAGAAVCNSRDFLCGVELEIEDIKSTDDVSANYGDVIIEQDHSLRNNGLEFKYGPVTYNEALNRFNGIWKHLKVGKNPFSERTSIHVHVNARCLTVEEARQLVLVYALYEPLFFKFVGDERKNNIFCVPLNYTSLPNTYKSNLVAMHKAWSKYTAFNICPMGPGKDGSACHGTIEFRHMYGTKDPEVFKKWLTTLKELYTFVEKNTGFDIIKTILSGKDMASYASVVIPTIANGLSMGQINNLIEDSLIDVKLSSGGLTK